MGTEYVKDSRQGKIVARKQLTADSSKRTDDRSQRIADSRQKSDNRKQKSQMGDEGREMKGEKDK